jgi:Protein of unknown function, DUF547
LKIVMTSRPFAALIAAGLLAAARAASAQAQPDPAPLDAVLAARARAGGFDYRAVTGQDRKRLAAYLSNLGDADPLAMAEGERKAFYINAYNALAIAVVLERYPVRSILDVDGAFKAVRRRIGREMLTLDDIENRLRDLRDARIHFVIVCASKSCPPLATKAYRAAGLDAALDAQGRAFVNDPSKNRLDRDRGTLELSKIFEWNRKEFERDGGTLPKYVGRFVAEPSLQSWVTTFPKPSGFLEYDWALNQP